MSVRKEKGKEVNYRKIGVKGPSSKILLLRFCIF